MSSSNNNSDDSSTTTFDSSEVSIPRSVRFWIMLLFDVPSIICSFLIIIHIIMNRVHRYALHNHSILLIILFGLPLQIMDIGFYLIFFHYGSVTPSQPIVCLLWWVADYGFYIGIIILMAWLAIERHILIFHDRWVSNQRGRFLFHYLPLIMLVTYIFIFYTIAIFFVPCENTYSYDIPVCGATPCYQSYGILGMWDFIVNTIIPILLEGIASISLILRVQCHRRRLRQSNKWRKQRRMIIQLFMVSSLNIGISLPIFLIPLAHLCGLPPQYGVEAELYFYFFGYFIVFLFPFASLSQYSDLRRKIKNKIVNRAARQPRRTATVGPTMRDIPMIRQF
ncbi:unnamed protein product [Adineta steineri]|uniref:G-protein coupled receptors family 1 profile domain-containing protein n=1 Tax=Adineta steineri TaxID=433720 RepID=A0A814MYM5_9BILA|nr:unnamed protein product [Adineta steineri]CAF1174811.1 unnamed protein product [Adineta steineri]